jgi:hypothetical protein
MATYTTNYNLYKPNASDDFGDFRSEFNDNMDIIDANLGGGGGSSTLSGLSDVDINSPTDGEVLTYDGNSSKWINSTPSGGGDVVDVEVNGVSVVDGNKVAKIVSYKEVTQAQYDALPSSKLTDGIAYFIKDGGGGSGSGGSFLLMITAETGLTVTATKGGTTLTATEVSTGIYEVEITSSGTWTISDGTNTATVDVGIYTATLSSVPEGSTVLPTDDVSIWLACGGRTENYTTVSEVLADSTCLLALLSDNNANDYLVRSTTWASTITADSNAMTYIGLNNYCANTLIADSVWLNAIANSEYIESVLNVKVPTMTGYTTPEGEVFQSSVNGSRYGWYAFDNNLANFWASTSRTNSYIGYRFAQPFRVRAVRIAGGQPDVPTQSPKNIIVQCSTNGLVYEDVQSLVVSQYADEKFGVINDLEVNYWRVFCTDNYGGPTATAIREIQFYGRKDI